MHSVPEARPNYDFVHRVEIKYNLNTRNCTELAIWSKVEDIPMKDMQIQFQSEVPLHYEGQRPNRVLMAAVPAAYNEYRAESKSLP